VIDLHTHLWPHEPGTELPTYDELAWHCERAADVGVEQIAVTEHCAACRRRVGDHELRGAPARRRSASVIRACPAAAGG
jgi:hypothetical protein